MTENYLSMNVVINGETKELQDGLSLNQLIERLSLPARRMAVEVNKHVIRKQDWDKVTISEKDSIEIVHFVGGG
jgi:sulfur carrier protein